MAKTKKTTTCDAKIAELEALQAIIDRRTEIENEAIALISECRFEEAMQLLDTLPDPELPDEEPAPVQEEDSEELEKLEDREDTRCIMPEMPYCPACQYGHIVPDLDDDTCYTWYCLLKSLEVQHGKKECC